MRSLPIFVRLAGRPVILLGEGEAAAAKRRLLERAGAKIVGEQGEAALAIVAVEGDAEAEAAVARLRARGILVNATDRPALCDFTLPGIVDRDPVLVAIGTDGASAGLAKALRQRFERLVPQSLGKLAEALHTARPEIRERWPDPADRRRAIDAALDEGSPLDPFREAGDVGAWLDGESDDVVTGLFAFTLESDDPDDLTLRQARLLGQADTIVHSAGVAAAILARGRADAIRIVSDEPPALLPAGLTVQLRVAR